MTQWPSEAEIRKMCRQWQEMLRLQNWNVSIRYARIRDMMDDDGNIAWGRCGINENHLTAKVLILHPSDYETDEGRLEIEATIVHELLHILLNGIRRNDQEHEHYSVDTAEEQAINVSSGLLVSLSNSLYDALRKKKK